MRRNPDARLDTMVECCFDEESGWYAVVRGVRFQEKEPTAADLAACQDISWTFLLQTDEGRRLCQSYMVSWFASGMASADAYDWRGDSYADLARAHELPIRRRRADQASAMSSKTGHPRTSLQKSAEMIGMWPLYDMTRIREIFISNAGPWTLE